MYEKKRNYINQSVYDAPKTGVLFEDFILQVTSNRRKKQSKSYFTNYKSVLHHLKGFCELSDAILYTNSINEEFLNDFIDYLEYKDLRASYISTILQCIKAMVAKAAIRGYAIDPSYEEVSFNFKEDPMRVYLTMNEITRLYYYENLSTKQMKIKDLFIIGCLTGLRYSDYSNLSADDISGDFIVKITKKTKKKVMIPIHAYVREIFEKYKGVPCKGLSVQYFNRAIKEICRKVSFDNDVQMSIIKGGEIRNKIYKKYELISSHTARRSMATNMYLTKRMSTSDIMQVTGHTTESSFFKYIKQSDEDKARAIASDAYFRV